MDIDLDVGTHKITTEYNGLKNTNKIRIIKNSKSSTFLHTTLIPNYVNVTPDYVYYNSIYSLKTGVNGIIKIPKNYSKVILSRDLSFHLQKQAKSDFVGCES